MVRQFRVLKKWQMCSTTSLSVFLPRFVLRYQEQKSHPLNYLKNRNTNSFFISPATHSEIEDIIISLKNGKSTGPFSIPVKLLKLIKSDISRPLACIFNEPINLGIFPDKLKQAKLIPIYKKGTHTDISNYRPISLLSAFSKIDIQNMNILIT